MAHQTLLMWLASVVTTIAATAVNAADRDKYFESAGVRIHYTDQGSGEPVVLVHGFAASALLNWEVPGIVSKLAGEYRVIAIDTRGHGRSGKPHAPKMYGLEMVHDLVRLLDHLQIDKAHFVGYSLGAFVTGKLIEMFPQRVMTATLGGAGWHRAGDKRFTAVIDELAESLETGRGITPLIEALSPDGSPPLPQKYLDQTNLLLMLTNDTKALAAAIRGMKHLAVSRAQLEKNRVPTLALIGEVDPLRVSVDELQQVMPMLDVVVIKRVGHMDAFMRPLFLDALKQHLRRHATADTAKSAAGDDRSERRR